MREGRLLQPAALAFAALIGLAGCAGGGSPMDMFGSGDAELTPAQQGLREESERFRDHRIAAPLPAVLAATLVARRGVFDRVASPLPPAEVGIVDPRTVMRKVGSRLLDSVGWRPLSTEWDYRATMKRIYRELFTPDFLAPLGLPAANAVIDASAARREKP